MKESGDGKRETGNGSRKLPAFHTSVVVAFVAALIATLLLLVSCASPEPYGDWRDYNQVDWSPKSEGGL